MERSTSPIKVMTMMGRRGLYELDESELPDSSTRVFCVNRAGVITLPRGPPQDRNWERESMVRASHMNFQLKHITESNWLTFAHTSDGVPRKDFYGIREATEHYWIARHAMNRIEGRLRYSDYEQKTWIWEQHQKCNLNLGVKERHLDFCEWHAIRRLNHEDAAISIQSIFRGCEERAWLAAALQMRRCDAAGRRYAGQPWNLYDRGLAAVEIQRIFRGNVGKNRASWSRCIQEVLRDYHTHKATVYIQAVWRRYKMRNQLLLLRALRQIDLRLCRARYVRVIEAASVIHGAWDDYKLRRRVKCMYREQARKEYVVGHGLDDLFANAIDLAIQNQPDDPAAFVSNCIRHDADWLIVGGK